MTGDGVTAVIVNWRTPELTLRAARALIADGVPPQRLVVVDNGSGDDSLERMRGELPTGLILALPENVGFARANNIAARELPAQLAYLFVNSDAFVHRGGSVDRLFAALDDPGTGIVVPRLLNEDLTLQPSVVPLSRLMPELARASGLSRYIPNRLQPRLATHWDHSYSRTIQAAVGPVLLVRAGAWDQLGGFDERSFMYTEDLDLFWRAARLRWRARFVAEAEFVHLGGASASAVWSDPQRAERIAKAEAKMLREHLGPVRARLTLSVMAAGVGARAAIHRIRGDHEAAQAQLAWMRGYLSRQERARAPRG